MGNDLASQELFGLELNRKKSSRLFFRAIMRAQKYPAFSGKAPEPQKARTRGDLLVLLLVVSGAFVLLGGALSFSLPASAKERENAHALSLFDSVKYPPDFEAFDYVNRQAPKGGTLRLAAIGTFDSLNPFIVKGRPASGLRQIYDTLMTSSYDEPGSEYGLIARTVSHPDDFSSVTFALHPDARFHDGERIKPEDVIWTFETLKANHPHFAAYYADVERAEKLSALEVRFTFSVTGNRELPLITGQLPVLPQHYWAGKTFTETSLVPPPGSGPYRIRDIKPGQEISYERVKTYWAKDLPVNRGQHNFDTIRYIYFRDSTIALEAMKSGSLDIRTENSAKSWATEYDFSAVREGRIVLEKIASQNGTGMQAFVFNTRKTRFQDPGVREAFNWAFDFEWTNATLFYGQYARTNSYFSNSGLAASGLPDAQEQALLEPYRDVLPETVFTRPFANPVTDGSGRNREHLRKARQLLVQAGWEVEDGQLTHTQTGEKMSVEFLLVQPTFERVVLPYKQALEILGINVTIRTVDIAQYQNRLDEYDFDMVVASFPQSLSPGNEQRDFWGCRSAQEKGGRNLIGICDPVVEALTNRIILAKDREELVTATRALDRVLLASHYVVPQWNIASRRIARWKDIRHPDPMPPYSIGLPGIWWKEPQ